MTDQGRPGTRGYTTALVLCATPEDVHAAVTNPRGWWGESVTGASHGVGDEFTFEVSGVHWSRLRVAECGPTRIAWDVVDARIEYVEDHAEWVGTRIVFALEPVPEGTRLSFQHDGLMPDLACYDSCSLAWASLIHDSLRRLVTEGRGEPYAAAPLAG
jgi:hypothetical protein